jgi:hypothetical protein
MDSPEISPTRPGGQPRGSRSAVGSRIKESRYLASFFEWSLRILESRIESLNGYLRAGLDLCAVPQAVDTLACGGLTDLDVHE